MAFTLEDGTGVANANSYLDAAGAETYFADRGLGTSNWDGLSAADKQETLVVATQYVDGRYGERFAGWKRTKEQGLEWPRADAYDRNGWLVASDSVPQPLKDAVAEVALKVAAGTSLTVDAEGASDPAVKTVDQVGPIRQERVYDGSDAGRTPPDFPLVDMILAPLMSSDATTALVRA